MAIRSVRPHRLPRSLDVSGVRIESSRVRSDRAIAAFWRWWRTGGSALSAACVAARTEGRVVPEITSLVEAVDPGLSWEFVPGDADGGPHRLTVTAAGVPELRGVARRWLEGAPREDPRWTYSDLREPVAGTALFFRDRRLAFEDAEIVVDLGLSCADVTVYHPHLDGLGAADRATAAYLLLDAVCGEELVETWVGRIRANAMAPTPETATRRLVEAPAILRALAADNVDDSGDPAWQILHGDTPGGPMVAMVRVPLVALSDPSFDRHVAVDVPYTDVEECGLPGSESLRALLDFEDLLSRHLGDDGECVAAESCDGRRRLHFYVDSRSGGVEALRSSAGEWPEGTVTVEVSDDPGWRRVAHLRA